MSHLLRSLLFCVFLHYSRSDPRVYEDTYRGKPIKMHQIDPERRPLYLLDPKEPIDEHYLLSMRKYLREDVIGPANRIPCQIKRSPKTEDLEREGQWSWLKLADYNPTNIKTSNDLKDKKLNEMLEERSWYEPPIGTQRTIDGKNGKPSTTFTVHPFYLRPDLTPPVRRISFELRIGYENTNINNADTIEELIRHPLGKTGVAGIGLLGNHLATMAADLYFMRAHISGLIPVFNDEGVLLFEILLVNRKDEGGYASPGGVVEPGETPFEAAVREWAEEVTGNPTAERVHALQEYIQDFMKFCSNAAKYFNMSTEQEINTKKAELAESERAAKEVRIQEILKESLGQKDGEGRMNGFWCLYKGHAGDRRDSDKARMETVVFVKDLTQSKLIIPAEFSGSDEVKGNPRFITLTEEWLATHKTFAKHGDYLQMILKYIIPLHSKTLQDILPGAGEGLAVAAVRAIKNIFENVKTAILWLNDSANIIPPPEDEKQAKSKEDINHEIMVEWSNAFLLLDRLDVAVKKVQKEHEQKPPIASSLLDKNALIVGKSAFDTLKRLKTALAQIPQLPPPGSQEAKKDLIKATEALMARIVAAYQQIQYYIHAAYKNLPKNIPQLSDSLKEEFLNLKKLLAAVPSDTPIESTHLINAKSILARAETEIRGLRGL